jgi:hypothetical protein
MEVIVILALAYLLILKTSPEDYEGDDTVQTDSNPHKNRDDSLFSLFF